MRTEETRSRPLAKRLRHDMTKAETVLWTRLKGRQVNGWRFRRQHPVGPYVADFACLEAELILEVDGATHSAERDVRHDARRTAYLEANGWSVLRVWNTDIYENLGGVMDMVFAALPPLGPSGHSPRKRGETSADANGSSLNKGDVNV